MTMQKHFTAAARFVIRPRAARVLRNMHAQKPRLAAVDLAEPVDERGPPRSQRFDLGSGQNMTGLEGVLDVIIIAGLTVLGDQLAARLLGHSPQVTDTPWGCSSNHSR